MVAQTQTQACLPAASCATELKVDIHFDQPVYTYLYICLSIYIARRIWLLQAVSGFCHRFATSGEHGTAAAPLLLLSREGGLAHHGHAPK